jgi:hypothetical protein
MSHVLTIVRNNKFVQVRSLFEPKWRQVEEIGSFKVVQNTATIDPVFTVTTGPEPTQAESEYCVTSKSSACRRARGLAEQTEWLAKSKERAAKSDERAAAKADKPSKQINLLDKSELDAVKADNIRLQAELDQVKAAVAELLAASKGRRGRKVEAE